MKAFIALFALVAAVSAEADPSLYLGAAPYAAAPYAAAPAYGYGLPYAAAIGYAGYNAAGLPTIKAAPCVNVNGEPTPCANAPAIYAPRLLHKREAEADAEPGLLPIPAAYPYAAAAAYPYAAAAAYPYAAAPLYGYTHPSNLGICSNYLGQRVPC